MAKYLLAGFCIQWQLEQILRASSANKQTTPARGQQGQTNSCCCAPTLWYHGVAEREQSEELAGQLRVWLLGPLQPHQPVIVKVEEGLTVLVVCLLISHIQLQPAPAQQTGAAGTHNKSK
jgi:hypothetical protein